MQDNSSTQITRQNTCRLFFLFSLLLLLAYSNSFQASWQIDDSPNILKNPNQQITELSWNSIWRAMTAHPSYPNKGELSRPVARVSLGLNWLWGQADVTGYHIVNFIIHLITCCLLYLTIKVLFKSPRLKDKYSSDQVTFIAVIATLFWALNPMQVQAVTYIVQRMASLAALFSLLALLYYLKARMHHSRTWKYIFFTSAALSYILAILSKENASILPLILPVLEILFFQPTLSRKKLRSYTIRAGLLLLLFSLVTLALKPGVFKAIVDPTSFDHRPFTQWERILTEQRILVFYLSQLFFPHPGRLSVQHDIILSTSLFSPVTTVCSIGFNLLLLLSALKLYRRQPLFTLAIIFYYLNHIIESTVLPLELLFEHRNYLPSLFLFLPVAQFLAFLLEKCRGYRLLTLLLVITIATSFTTLAYATFTRNKAWKTVPSLWIDAAAKAPLSARPISALAYELGFGKNQTLFKYRKALELQKRALSMKKNRGDIDAAMLGNIATLNIRLGNIQNGLKYYEKALALNPDGFRVQYHYSKVLLWTGQFKQAREEIVTVLQAKYFHPDCWNLLGVIDMWTGHLESALAAIQNALHAAPNRPDINLHLGKCMSMLGYNDRARFFYQRSRENGGDNPLLSLCIIENALKSNDNHGARSELKRALTRYPVATLLSQIRPRPEGQQFRSIPLDKKLLTSFILSEFDSTIDLMINNENEK